MLTDLTARPKAIGWSRSTRQAGRGRQGRTWLSLPGNFYGSTLVTPAPAIRLPQTLSLAAGLASIEAIDVTVPGQPLLLKWPNDLMLGGKKLAGILLERSGDRVAVGFGVNLAAAPQLPDREGASLGGKVLPEAFAPLLAAASGACRPLAAERADNARPGLARPGAPNRNAADGSFERRPTVTGTFDGIEPDGALRLRLADGSIGDRSRRRRRVVNTARHS